MTLVELRKLIAQQLGLSDFNGTASAYAELSPRDQERLSIGVVRYIVANPDEFSATQVEKARILAEKTNFGKTGDYSDPDFLDQADAFIDAYGEVVQRTAVAAAKTTGEVARGLGIDLRVILPVAAVAAIVYFGAPYVLPKLRAALPGK